MSDKDKPMSALDEIFPKDVMERAKWFVAVANSQNDEEYNSHFQAIPEWAIEEILVTSLIWEIQEVSDYMDFTIVAYDGDKEELARRRIRLSLNVEVLDDQPAQGEEER